MCCSCLADTCTRSPQKGSACSCKEEKLLVPEHPCCNTCEWGDRGVPALQVAFGRCCSGAAAGLSAQDIPEESQSRGNPQGSHSLGGEEALCEDLPMGMGSHAPGAGPHPHGGHRAAPTHNIGFFCVLRGRFPGRNNSSEPQGLLSGSSCYCFLKITIVGGLCSLSFFLNSILSVMLQLLKWSFP